MTFILGTIYFIFFISACAVVRAPTGGQRDTIPPHLLGSIPANYSKNYQGSQIILIFDEYIKIKDQSTSVFISPEPDKSPEVKVKQKNIVISFKKPLEKNRTYSISFGNAIVDNNEGNILHNFKFVLSTGAHIDSLKITGHVSDPLDTASKKDIYVILQPAAKDSAIYKSKPLLYTSTDKDGNFEISNIGRGDYNIYALEETNKNKKYDNKSESIAFLNQSIHLQKDTSGIQLNLFKEKEDRLKILSKKIAGGLVKILTNKPSDSLDFKLTWPKLNQAMQVEKNAHGDTTFLWLPKADLDSVKIAVLEKNSKPIVTSLNNFVKTKKANSLTLSGNLVNGLLTPGKTLELRFSEPLRSIQPEQIIMLEDSIPVKTDSIIQDPLKVRTYLVYFPFEPKRNYQLKIQKEKLESIFGAKNKEFNLKWKLGEEKNYGTIRLNVKVPEESDYMVYLMNEQSKILETRFINKSAVLTYRYLNPGNYKFRIVYDRNRNHVFDSGNLGKKLQPEKVVHSQQIGIKANFELNKNFILPAY